ncbi:MAG: four helix bundle protein [Prevotellaceae bacterium]|jgi:four helix bundle protein|nr:four helix bundle protein [Prevotellaceae bacterium]
MDNILAPKSYKFALRVVALYKWLCAEKKEFVLSKQILRSGTAVGALVREAEHTQSKADFLNKMNISLKEANEAEYWLMLLKDSDFLSKEEFQSVHTDCDELIRLLVSIVKTTKISLNRT